MGHGMAAERWDFNGIVWWENHRKSITKPARSEPLRENSKKCRFVRLRRFARNDEWDIGCHHPQKPSVRQVGCPPVAAFSLGDFAPLRKTHDRLERGKVQLTLAGLRILPELTASWNTGPGPASFLCAFAASREMLYSARSAPRRELKIKRTFRLLMGRRRHGVYPALDAGLLAMTEPAYYQIF